MTVQETDILREIADRELETLADLFRDDGLSMVLARLGVGGEAEPEIDQAEELRKRWGVKRGQLWRLGAHRLMCGDSTSEADVGHVLSGKLFDTLVTSPPYNVGVRYADHDDMQASWPGYEAFLRGVLDQAIPRMRGGRLLAWNIGASPKTHHARQHLLLEDVYGLTYYRQMVWRKIGVPVPLWFNTVRHPLARRFTPNYTHEIVLLFSKGKIELGGLVDVDMLCENDVFEVAQNMATVDLPAGTQRTGVHSGLERRSKKAHPAAFPERIPAMFITHLTEAGELVYEPFLGSGTTIVACERLCRRCAALEISPAYCALSIQRWADMTGGRPELLDG